MARDGFIETGSIKTKGEGTMAKKKEKQMLLSNIYGVHQR